MANGWERAMRYLGVRNPDPRIDAALHARIDELEARVRALEATRPESPEDAAS